MCKVEHVYNMNALGPSISVLIMCPCFPGQFSGKGYCGPCTANITDVQHY